MKFLFGTTLGRASTCLAIPPRKTEQRLPQILSSKEIDRLFAVTKNIKHRTLLMTAYAAGLRVSELVRLKVTDIDSDRMTLRIVQGKGRKDRLVPLSPKLLLQLRHCSRAEGSTSRFAAGPSIEPSPRQAMPWGSESAPIP